MHAGQVGYSFDRGGTSGFLLLLHGGGRVLTLTLFGNAYALARAPPQAVNWLANLAVGLLFLPLRDALARGHSGETGTVFWVFTAMTGVGVVVVARLLR